MSEWSMIITVRRSCRHFVRVYLFFYIMKDFFRSYRAAKIRSYTVPAVFALVLSIGIVGLNGSGNMGMIQANVLGGLHQDTPAHADLILDRTGGDISVSIGKNANQVDGVNFTILGDPTKFTALTSTDPAVKILMNEPWMALVKVSLSSQNLIVGQNITTLHASLATGTTLSVTDASFSSQGTLYNLSVEGN